MERSEEQLLALAVQGDAEALSVLLERHGPPVRQGLTGGIARKWRSVLSVDDVMQQTYTDAFLTIRRFESRESGTFEGWLATLARRNLLDAVRLLSAEKRGGDRHRVTPLMGDESMVALYELVGGSVTTPSSHAAKGEAKSALERAIECLPANYQKVVCMYDLEGRPIEEVAAAMERSAGAVYMIRARAHDRLGEILGAPQQYLSDHH
jgi:RNA polymerase sigma factor (sigma-70 family)